jgi:hypothetical protein
MNEKPTAKARTREAIAWAAAGAPLTLLHFGLFAEVTGIESKLAAGGLMRAAFNVVNVTLVVASIASWPVWLLIMGLSHDDATLSRKIQAGLLVVGWCIIMVGVCFPAIR